MEQRNSTRFTVEQRAQAKLQARKMMEAGFTQQQIADHFGISQPTVCQWLYSIAPTPQQRVAEQIRAELVCCDIYERITALDRDRRAQRELRDSVDFHAICFYGEFAARIAEKVR